MVLQSMYSFDKYLSRACYMPNSVTGAGRYSSEQHRQMYIMWGLPVLVSEKKNLRVGNKIILF